MPLFIGPRQGEHHPFSIPEADDADFVVGLGWNQNSPGSFLGRLAARVKGLLGGDGDDGADEHDLDLYAYVFDDAHRLKAVVSPDDNSLVDISGAVFHSGDDKTGATGEVITVRIGGIPDDYRHFFFLVRSNDDLKLDEVGDARIILESAAGRSLNNPITPPAHVQARGYVFCHVARAADGWTCRSLDVYTNFEENWSELLASFNAPGPA